ncbi:MAG: hypothetical protein ACREN5_01085 [Gemmatimonadales bacterium]
MAKLPRSLLELRVAPPCEWTVVRGPLNAARVPAGARDGYVVCPNCRHRDPLPDARVSTTRCPRCNEVFTVAWDEAYPRMAQGGGRERALVRAVGPQVVTRPLWDTLAPDRRMTRRRSTANRRTGLERRTAARRALILATKFLERRLAERRQPTKRRTDRDRRNGSERRRRAAGW